MEASRNFKLTHYRLPGKRCGGLNLSRALLARSDQKLERRQGLVDPSMREMRGLLRRQKSVGVSSNFGEGCPTAMPRLNGSQATLKVAKARLLSTWSHVSQRLACRTTETWVGVTLGRYQRVMLIAISVLLGLDWTLKMRQ
jgi:hypothetical protein